MPKPYSFDLRQRVLAACDEGLQTRQQIAKRFQVGKGTVYNWLALRKEQQSCQPRPYTGGNKPVIDQAGREILAAFAQSHNDATLAEYQHHYQQQTGRRVGVGTIQRALLALGLTLKKRRFEPVSENAKRSKLNERFT